MEKYVGIHGVHTSNESSIDFKFIECIRDCYLFQHVNKPTRGRFNQDPHCVGPNTYK